VIERLLDLSLSTSALSRFVERDGEEVQAFYAEKLAPNPSSEAPVLVIQADGKGVPMRPASERSGSEPRAAPSLGPNGRPSPGRRACSGTRPGAGTLRR
jgi:hypothetical protein